ncbi:MAG: hypothetical protein Q9210_007355 [Variospora velana]
MAQNGPRLGKGGRIIKAPRVAGKTLNKFKTSFYTLYDPALHRQAARNVPVGEVTTAKNYRVFNDYYLYSDPTTTREEIHQKIPKRGVRLDDKTMALVLPVVGAKERNEWWPGEFDHNGMPRATRIPLGQAAKMWVSAGDVDVDGHVATEGDQGYYYLWWKGLQVLMGKEGHDAGLYMVRPSWELDECDGFGFKLSHRAVVQAP